MLDTIKKNLCELTGINEENFKHSKAGGYIASNREVVLRTYSGKGWDGLEARHTDDERWEFDITYDDDACRLEVIIVTSHVTEFKQAAAKLKNQGDLYTRFNEGCSRRISDSDREGYSTLTLEVRPGEEVQAAEIIYSLLLYKTKSSQTPDPKKKKYKSFWKPTRKPKE